MGNRGEKNLKPFGPNDGRTKDEQRRIRQNGGRASGEARRRKKLLKECLEILLETEFTDESEKGKKKKKTGAELMAKKAFEAALHGDWDAWKLVRDTSGQKPSDKLVVSEVDPAIIEEIERMLHEEEEDNE